jgi:long-chain acyl-CoA synthetase
LSKAATRERILEAAREVAAAGAERFRIAEVVRCAGVVTGTFYLHFESVAHLGAHVRRRALCEVLHAAASGCDVPPQHRRGLFFEAAAAARPVLCSLADIPVIRRAELTPCDVCATATAALVGPPESQLAAATAALRELVSVWALSAAPAEALGGCLDLLAGEGRPRGAGRIERADALLFDGGWSLSSVALHERVAKAATVLGRRGLSAGDRVCLLLRNGPAAIELLLAAQRIGLTVVPLNTYWRTSEVEHVLTTSGAAGLAFHDDFRGVVDALPPELARRLTLIPIGSADGEERYERDLAAADPYDGPPAEQSGTLWFTSGSTGLPKGVVRFETSLERSRHARFLGSLFGLSAEDTLLVAGPLHHAANRLYAGVALETGARLVVTKAFDAADFGRLVEEHRVTVALVVPTMLYRLTQLDPPLAERHDLSSLRAVVHMGGPCSIELKERAFELFGPIVYEYYGTTEMGGTMITPEEWLRHRGSVGRAWHEDTVVAVVDDDGDPLPPDVVGNVALLDKRRAPFTYLDGTADGAATFTADGCFVTGDLGRLDGDGYLYLADRRSAVINSGGVAIYPSEVEAALSTSPGVLDCAVVGLPDQEWGQRVVALVQPAQGEPVDLEALRERLRSRLAHYKCPRDWYVVDRIPRDGAGKLMRRELGRQISELGPPAMRSH